MNRNKDKSKKKRFKRTKRRSVNPHMPNARGETNHHTTSLEDLCKVYL